LILHARFDRDVVLDLRLMEHSALWLDPALASELIVELEVRGI
jgi:hypothetical protein